MDINEILNPVFLSLKTGAIATLVNIPTAIVASVLLTRSRIPGKHFLEGILNLPLVMPPVTTGYILLLILGKRGILGAFIFKCFGITLAFTQSAAIIASMLVSFPLVVRSIKISFEMIESKLEAAAGSLGAPPVSVFFRVTLPLIFPGVINGAVLGFARSMGEFGATITFAGNIAGKTRTIPLSVYSLLQVPGKEKEAALFVMFSIIISFLSMFISAFMGQRYSRNRTVSYGS